MFATVPAFVGGLLYGNAHPRTDPYAHYKLMSLTSTIGFIKIMGEGSKHFAVPPMTPARLLFTGTMCSVFVSGTLFCMGTMLTRIA